MASSGNIEIEKFNGQSVELWKLKMLEITLRGRVESVLENQ